MADKKISDLTSTTGANVSDANDTIAIVDASADSTKKITREELFKGIEGNVGIGIASPSRGPLHLHGSGSVEHHMTNTSSGSTGSDGFTLFLDDTPTTGGAGVWLREEGPLRFATNATERMRIDSSGNTRPGSDNLYDLGTASFRWDDVYATNGTIQTSDANEKQQIAALTDAEMVAAKAISAGFKTFKWNDIVEEKGDAARIHSGVIAQEVEQALTDAGLDAGDYAFFISNAWWETQTEVPAVEATEAYTRIDTYLTLEEAPEGATERNRKGIRYPELLAFVGAATEQRLTAIETRLTELMP